MEHSRNKTKLEVFRISWKESLIAYRKALKLLDLLIFRLKHNPRYLFDTVAKLTRNNASTSDVSQTA